MTTRVFLNAQGKMYSGTTALSTVDSELPVVDSYLLAQVTATPQDPQVVKQAAAVQKSTDGKHKPSSSFAL